MPVAIPTETGEDRHLRGQRGPPIPAAALARIFEPTQRASTSSSSGRSSSIVEAYGGSLTAASTAEEGHHVLVLAAEAR